MDAPSTSSPTKISLEDFAWLWVAGFAGMLAGAATVAIGKIDFTLVSPTLLFLLHPGLAAASYGFREDRAAAAALIASSVNAGLYGTLVVAGRLIWRYIGDEHTMHPPR